MPNMSRDTHGRPRYNADRPVSEAPANFRTAAVGAHPPLEQYWIPAEAAARASEAMADLIVGAMHARPSLEPEPEPEASATPGHKEGATHHHLRGSSLKWGQQRVPLVYKRRCLRTLPRHRRRTRSRKQHRVQPKMSRCVFSATGHSRMLTPWFVHAHATR